MPMLLNARYYATETESIDTCEVIVRSLLFRLLIIWFMITQNLQVEGVLWDTLSIRYMNSKSMQHLVILDSHQNPIF